MPTSRVRHGDVPPRGILPRGLIESLHFQLRLTILRRACIDIGSNTTRLLVADCQRGELHPVYEERAFTHVRQGLLDDGTITTAKLAEIAQVVAGQLLKAQELGAVAIYGVATASIRRAGNGGALLGAVREACELEIEILSGEEEARLAFVGVAGTLGHTPDGELGVVDVGGSSLELVVGSAPDRVRWSRSFALGSGDVLERWLGSDPPSASELSDARGWLLDALDGLEAPHPAEAVAVGGSSTSLYQLAGPLLDAQAFERSLGALVGSPARDVASSYHLKIDRVRLLPAELLILQATSELFGAPLQIGRGGMREGVLLEGGDG